MTKPNEIRQQFLTGERALFHARDLNIYDTIFDDGESPLKESRNIELWGSMFRWKYPLWYCKHIKAHGCTWFEMARAGVWYTDDILVEDAVIENGVMDDQIAGVEQRPLAGQKLLADLVWFTHDSSQPSFFWRVLPAGPYYFRMKYAEVICAMFCGCRPLGR